MTVLFTIIQVKAQDQSGAERSKIGLGAMIALPVGDYNHTANFGTGVSLLYQQVIAQDLSFTVELGYLRFHGKEIFENIKYKAGFVPIKVGGRYYFGNHFYGSGQAGISISTANGTGSGTSFAYAAGMGYEFAVSNTGSLDLGVHYEGWTRNIGTVSFTGLSVRYNF